MTLKYFLENVSRGTLKSCTQYYLDQISSAPLSTLKNFKYKPNIYFFI